MPTASQIPNTASLGQSAAGAATRRPIQYGRNLPGTRQQVLGDKVRQETSMALEQLLKHGSFRTGLEPFISKMAEAQQLSFGNLLHERATGFSAPPAAPAAAPKASPIVGGRPGFLRRFGLPLALGAGAASALSLASGMKGLEEDRRRDALVYSPLQGVV
jgi:hypothetical protein